MGKGLALAFDRKYPSNSQAYRQACQEGRLAPGGLIPFEICRPWRFILNLATKRHWREPSGLADIAAGIVRLREFALEQKLRSLAVPAIGCGNGGLDWKDVLPMLERELGPLDCDVQIFPPQ